MLAQNWLLLTAAIGWGFGFGILLVREHRKVFAVAKTFQKSLLPLLAIGGLVFGIVKVMDFRKVSAAAKPVIEPASRVDPSLMGIRGPGIIEASQENVPIGANIPGVAVEVFVKVGNYVKAGQPLFRTDDRNLLAELKGREADLDLARAQLDRLKAAPQTQDIPTATAAVDEARAKVYDAEVINKRSSELFSRGMAPPSDYDRDRYSYQAAKATLARTEADLARIKITWAKDIAVSQAQVEQAQSKVESTKIDIERCIVRALVDGQVLQVNIRPGQFAGLVWKEALIVLGDVRTLNVRVDIDEQLASYYTREHQVFASVRGRPTPQLPLTKIVKTEPYVVPKKNLTGDTSERADTRVLQIVYALPDDRPYTLYVGQQMDVFFEPPKAAKTNVPKEGYDSRKAYEAEKKEPLARTGA